MPEENRILDGGCGTSIAPVRAASSPPDTVVQFPAGTRAAADAPAAIINFRSEGRHFAVGRLRVPVDCDHGFRWKMITQSGGT